MEIVDSSVLARSSGSEYVSSQANICAPTRVYNQILGDNSTGEPFNAPPNLKKLNFTLPVYDGRVVIYASSFPIEACWRTNGTKQIFNGKVNGATKPKDFDQPKEVVEGTTYVTNFGNVRINSVVEPEDYSPWPDFVSVTAKLSYSVGSIIKIRNGMLYCLSFRATKSLADIDGWSVAIISKSRLLTDDFYQWISLKNSGTVFSPHYEQNFNKKWLNKCKLSSKI